MNASKQKGTAWESAIVRYLQGFWPHVERRTQAGAYDRGDISGIPGVVIEAKSSGRAWRLPEWWRETQDETINADKHRFGGDEVWCSEHSRWEEGTDQPPATHKQMAKPHHGVLWIKRVGKTDPAHGWVVMDGETYVRLLKDAGW